MFITNRRSIIVHRLRVFLASTARYPFVQDDVEMLRRHFDVDVCFGSGARGAWEHFRGALRADVSIGWFGSVYTFFLMLGARLAGRGSIVILGGVDVAKMPELDYGIWRSWWKGRLLAFALERIDRILAVDMSLRRTLERSSGRTWERVEALPTGYDAGMWPARFPRERMVLCVAGTNSPERARIKGVDIFIAAAQHFPDVPFHVVGIDPEVMAQLAPSAPANLQLHPPVPRARLLDFYQRARVYCQPSRSEGLPNALCEAMLCGCVPVGTDVGGIPAAIDGCGFVVPPGDAGALAAAIGRGLEAPDSLGVRAREHIATTFSAERRETALVAIINQLGSAEVIR